MRLSAFAFLNFVSHNPAQVELDLANPLAVGMTSELDGIRLGPKIHRLILPPLAFAGPPSISRTSYAHVLNHASGVTEVEVQIGERVSRLNEFVTTLNTYLRDTNHPYLRTVRVTSTRYPRSMDFPLDRIDWQTVQQRNMAVFVNRERITDQHVNTCQSFINRFRRARQTILLH